MHHIFMISRKMFKNYKNISNQSIGVGLFVCLFVLKKVLFNFSKVSHWSWTPALWDHYKSQLILIDCISFSSKRIHLLYFFTLNKNTGFFFNSASIWPTFLFFSATDEVQKAHLVFKALSQITFYSSTSNPWYIL